MTLDPADATNDRIDAIIVDDTGTATKITGTPGSPPTDPSADPTSQLQLTFVYVAANATTPSNITTDNIYLENTEWTCAAGAGWNCASTTQPYAGTKDIEATAVAAGTYTTLTRGTPVALYNYNNLAFYIRSKATWNNNRSLTLRFYSGSTAVGLCRRAEEWHVRVHFGNDRELPTDCDFATAIRCPINGYGVANYVLWFWRLGSWILSRQHHAARRSVRSIAADYLSELERYVECYPSLQSK